jgi:hypothetical protein
MRKTLMAAIAAPAVMLFAGAAVAQQAPAQQPPQAQAAPAPAATDITDDELRGFAQAVGEIQGVMQQVPEGQAPSPEQQAEMEQAVDDAGLSVDRFNVVAQALPQDQALQQRMAALLEE